MKRIKVVIIMLLTVILTVNFLFAQISEEEKREIYPDKYTLEKAEKFQKKGEYEKAIWFYINLYPENKTQIVEIVKTLALKLDTVDIENFIKKSFTQYSTFDPAITTFNNGVPNIDIGKLKKKGAWGDELIQKISESNKHLSSASEYNLRGNDKVKAGDYKGAIEEYNKAIEINPTGQIYFNRAYSKSLTEDLYGAIKDFDKTIEFKYRLAEAYFERGHCKDKINSFLDAISDYTKAIEIKPSGQTYYNRGYSKSMVEDFNGAILDYDKSIELTYKLADAYFERGYCKDNINNFAGAIEDYTKAIEIKNDFVDAYNNRAVTKLKLKDFKSAIEDFDKAIKMSPDYVSAYVSRGFAKRELNDISGACKDWQKAVELGYIQANKLIKDYCE